MPELERAPVIAVGFFVDDAVVELFALILVELKVVRLELLLSGVYGNPIQMYEKTYGRTSVWKE